MERLHRTPPPLPGADRDRSRVRACRRALVPNGRRAIGRSGVAASSRRGLDRERLLPADDKRRRDLAKRLDKPPESNGWATFVAGQAHTIVTGKARNRRNAEIALVEAVSRWTADVAELPPDRMADLRAIVDYGLLNPKQLSNQNR